MAITVFHAKAPIFSTRNAAAIWKNDGYQKMAVVDTDDLDKAYELTNNIHDLWTKNQQIKESFNLMEVNGQHGARSTSVGDILEKDGQHYAVANVGFEEIAL